MLLLESMDISHESFSTITYSCISNSKLLVLTRYLTAAVRPTAAVPPVAVPPSRVLPPTAPRQQAASLSVLLIIYPVTNHICVRAYSCRSGGAGSAAGPS